MSVIWSGLTEEGAIVPVQVDSSGRVVAITEDTALDYWEKEGEILKPSDGESVSVDGTISSSVGFAGPTASFTADISIHGISVGTGGGSVSTNTALGTNALNQNTEGKENTAIGRSALFKNTTGSYNTALGTNALFQNTEGSENTAIGRNALYKNTTGTWNTALGNYVLNNNTEGSYNTAIGRSSLSSNTIGSSNTALGLYVLNKNTRGSANTALGDYALYNNTEGSYNTAIGRNALYKHTEGNYNTALGHGALNNITESSYNTAVGRNALSNLTTGDNNTFLGGNPGLDGLNDTVCISAGETSRLWIDSQGQAGIGTNNPQATLDVAGPALFSNGLCGFLASGEIFFQSRNTAYKLVVASNGLVSAEAIPSSFLRLDDRQELVIPPAHETSYEDDLSVVVMDNDNA